MFVSVAEKFSPSKSTHRISRTLIPYLSTRTGQQIKHYVDATVPMTLSKVTTLYARRLRQRSLSVIPSTGAGIFRQTIRIG